MEGEDPAAAPLASVKEAYDQWLKDMLKPLRKGKRRSKRLAALRHVQQPTESSACKRVPKEPVIHLAPKDVERAAADQVEAARRRFRVLADEANFSHYQYETEWGPGLGFFSQLARWARSKANESADRAVQKERKPRRWEMADFPVRVPPTVMRMHDGSGVVLFFTKEPLPEQVEEPVSNTSKPSAKQASDALTLQFHFFTNRQLFLSRLPWIVRMVLSGQSNHQSILALRKSMPSDGKHTHLDRLDSTEAVQQAIEALWDGQDIHGVQTYVATPNAKAWMARPVYRKKDQASSTVWILTGNDTTVASTEWPHNSPSPPCQVVKSVHPQSWQEPRTIASTLYQYFDLQVLRPSGVGTLAELAVDLAQDGDGHWWLLQVKAFQLRVSLSMPRLGKHDSQRARSAPDRLETVSVVSGVSGMSKTTKRAKRKCAGKYCDVEPASDTEPTAYLTKKELLSCEFFDRFDATGDASMWSGDGGRVAGALAFYLHHQIHKRDRTTLYEPQPLCLACLQRYTVLRGQLNDRIEAETGDATATVAVRTHKPRPKRDTMLASKSLAMLPVIMRKSVDAGETSSHHAASMTVLPPPSYMDELDKIERLLADSSGTESHSSTTRDQPPSVPTVNASTPAQDASFSWLEASHEDRIEKMWQSVRLVPLPASTSTQHPPGSAYNTFSLAAALKESASSPSFSSEKLASTATSPEPSHLISIDDCRRVIADESYREVLVTQASQHLLPSTHSHKNQNHVQYVVLPPDGVDTASGLSDHLALGRMALRTLALDVAQLLDQHGVSLPTRLPPIVDDAIATGTLFMTLGPE